MTEADKKIKQAQKQAKKDRKKAYKEQLAQYKTPLSKKDKVIKIISIVLAVVTALVYGGQITVDVLNKQQVKPFLLYEAKLILKYAPEHMECSYGNLGKKETYIEINEDFDKITKANKKTSALEETFDIGLLSVLQIYYYEGDKKVIVNDENTNSLIVIVNKSGFLLKANEKAKPITEGFKKAKIALLIVDFIVWLYAIYLAWGRKYDMQLALEKDLNNKSLQTKDGLSEDEAKKTANNAQMYKKKKKKKK